MKLYEDTCSCLKQLKQYEQNSITPEELLDVVLNSSAQASDDSEQPLPGDLLLITKAMNTAVSNMNSKQRMSTAKVGDAFSFWFYVSVNLI